MSISELRDMLDKRKISVLELCARVFKRIEEKSSLNCYITICEERALTHAKRAQKLIDKGTALPLCGIPISVKDNILTKGIKTTCASKMLSEFVPCYDAKVVEALDAQGFILTGKTNMDEFGMGNSSCTSYFGRVKNPYNPDLVSGGSSGGAAAAVALDLCVGALGSDTGGSVRQPAAFCGVTGIKPTYGTVSRRGLIAFASSLDQIGVMAKSAEDCGYILNAIGVYDKKDATMARVEQTDFLKKINTHLSHIVVGVPRECFSLDISEDVRKSFILAIEYFKKIGCRIKEVSLPALEASLSAYYIISSAEAASNLSRYDGIKYTHRSKVDEDYNELLKHSRTEGFGDEVKRRIMLGNYALSGGYYDEYYKNALKIREKIKAEYAEIFGVCDIVLTPTATSTAFDAHKKISPAAAYLSDILTVGANLAGLPAISTTCGYDRSGLPIGMSLLGRAFDDSLIIAVADRFEKDFKRQEAGFWDTLA